MACHGPALADWRVGAWSSAAYSRSRNPTTTRKAGDGTVGATGSMRGTGAVRPWQLIDGDDALSRMPTRDAP